MSQKTNEQLIDAIEEIVARYDIDADKKDARIMRQAIERLRQQSEDSERLDWLNREDVAIDQLAEEVQLEVVNRGYFYGASIREAIDKARKV